MEHNILPCYLTTHALKYKIRIEWKLNDEKQLLVKEFKIKEKNESYVDPLVSYLTCEIQLVSFNIIHTLLCPAFVSSQLLQYQLETVIRGLPRNWCNWQSAQLVGVSRRRERLIVVSPVGLNSPLTLNGARNSYLLPIKINNKNNSDSVKIILINIYYDVKVHKYNNILSNVKA